MDEIIQPNIDKERTHLLEKCHSLSFHMYLTALPSEECFEVEIISSKGTSYYWKAFDDFEAPAYCLDGIVEKRIRQIKEKIKADVLYLADIDDTQLKYLVPSESMSGDNIAHIFKRFLDLPDSSLENIYCLEDSKDGLFFYSNEDAVALKLDTDFPVNTEWEKLSNQQITDYLNRIEDNKIEIPFATFDSE